MKKVARLFSLFLLLTVFLVSCGPKVELIFIDSVKGIAKVQVALGTTQAEVMNELPTKVTITDNKGKNYEITASWALNGYDKDTVGTYTAKGTFTLPVGVSQKTPPVPLEVTVQIEVIRPQLHSVTALNEKYYVLLGTAKATAMTKLPTSTTVKDNLGKTYEVELNNWVCPTYNANAEADYPASATFEVPAQINDNSEVSKTVTTKLSVSDNRTLKSIKPVENITVSANTYNTYQIKEVLGLTTQITDSVDATHTVNLTWDVSAYDWTKTGEYTVSATFSLPSNVKNTVPPMELKVSAKITVISQIGSGTSGDPYIIENLTQLLNVKNGLDKHYKLKENIEIYAAVGTDYWTPLGDETVMFTGSFDGNGSVIVAERIGYDFSVLDVRNNVGIFGVIGATGVVKNLKVKYEMSNGNENIGVIAGQNKGKIENCTAERFRFNFRTLGNKNQGGLVGKNEGEVSNCISIQPEFSSVDGENVGGLIGYNTGIITDSTVSGETVILGKIACGGFVGKNSGTITDCISELKSNFGDDFSAIAGFVGNNETAGSISYCYVKGSMTGHATLYPSGFVAQNTGTVEYCYSNLTVSDGKMYGFAPPSTTGITKSYWIRNSSDQVNGTGNGIPSADATKIASYSNWNFGERWFIDESYPFLLRELKVKYDEGDGTISNPYVIKNAEQLGGIRYRLDKNYILGNNLILSGNWRPIGISGYDSIRVFTGTLDGNNKTIDGLSTNYSNGGLFAKLSKAAVKNLKFTNVNIKAGATVGTVAGEAGAQYDNTNIVNIENIEISGKVEGTTMVGGVVGVMFRGTLKNITVRADVKATGSTVGGICSSTMLVSLNDLIYEGNVSGSDTCGGILGKIEGRATLIDNLRSSGTVQGQRSIGGIVGSAKSVDFANISSVADISTTGAVSVEDKKGIGGLFGEAKFGLSVKDSFYNGNINGYGHTGGLIGYADLVTLVNCHSAGTITGTNFENGLKGGLIGKGYGSIDRCFSTMDILNSNYSGGLVGGFKDNTDTKTIKNSYATGTAKAGLVYDANRLRLENCYSTVGCLSNAGLIKTISTASSAVSTYWDSEVSGASSSAKYNSTDVGVSKTTSEMKNQATYVDWDFTNIWKIDPAQNNGYPTLR